MAEFASIVAGGTADNLAASLSVPHNFAIFFSHMWPVLNTLFTIDALVPGALGSLVGPGVISLSSLGFKRVVQRAELWPEFLVSIC